MPNIIHQYEPGQYVFITCVTDQRRKIFSEKENIKLLTKTIKEVKKIKPFNLNAFIIMPDHIHLLMYLANDEKNFYNASQIMHSIKRNFTLNWKNRKFGNIKHKKIKIWQSRFWSSIINNENDYFARFDYINYNAVKHGIVKKPCDWPYSSYMYYVKRGYYDLDDWN